MASFRELLAQTKQRIREIDPGEAEARLGDAVFLARFAKAPAAAAKFWLADSKRLFDSERSWAACSGLVSASAIACSPRERLATPA